MHVFINDTHIGDSEIGFVTVRGLVCEPYSHAYFCPCCGEIWARIFIDVEPQHWMVSTMLCAKHGLGSIWREWDKEYMDALPIEALKLEFLLAYDDPQWYFDFPYRPRDLSAAAMMKADLPDF